MDSSKEQLHEKRRWYTRWWGLLLLLVAGAAVIFLAGYLYYLLQYLRAYRTGEINLQEYASKITPNAVARTTSEELYVEVSEDDDPSMGSKDAKLVVIGFLDFECEYSRDAFPIMRELMTRYPNDLRFVFRDFPNSTIHAGAQTAHEAGECADDQGKFWEMHDKLFLNQPNFSRADVVRYANEINLDVGAFTSCLDTHKYKEEVLADYKAGLDVGLRGTPTWFVNGLRVEGVVPLNIWEKVIQTQAK